MNEDRLYMCIDLKSFYASVECVERGLDPLTTNLVVADPERTEKTICLAISPSMKALGIKNRCRVFEIPGDIHYLMAPPRMQLYIDYSAEIYGIYLKYIAKEDIHVYSIDEAFLDVTNYLHMYQMGARNSVRPLWMTFSPPPASLPPAESAPISIWQKLLWTSPPSTATITSGT